jgi:putative ABC transport system ATP-binding protein
VAAGLVAAGSADSVAVDLAVDDMSEPTGRVPRVEGGEPTGRIPRVDVDGDPTLAVRSPVIDMKHLWKTYRPGSLAVHALRGVTLNVDRGEFVAVMGPSGSGKSTLMHIMGCLDIPTSGTYELSGEDVSEMSENSLAHIRNREIGFVFQQYNLLPRLTAWRNVELPLMYARVPAPERRRRALASLQQVGLAERVDHRPTELSGGQQQRVALARALVTNPALLLADEPTGNLDTASALEILGLLQDLHRSGRTVVLITHEPDVAAVAGRVLRIRDGQIDSEEVAA